MRRSSNKSVKIVISDRKVDIYSIKDVLGQIFDNILGHLNVDVTLAVVVSFGSITNLDSCRLERCVGILIRRHQNYVLKPIQALHFTQLIQTALFEFI